MTQTDTTTQIGKRQETNLEIGTQATTSSGKTRRYAGEVSLSRGPNHPLFISRGEGDSIVADIPLKGTIRVGESNGKVAYETGVLRTVLPGSEYYEGLNKILNGFGE